MDKEVLFIEDYILEECPSEILQKYVDDWERSKREYKETDRVPEYWVNFVSMAPVGFFSLVKAELRKRATTA